MAIVAPPLGANQVDTLRAVANTKDIRAPSKQLTANSNAGRGLLRASKNHFELWSPEGNLSVVTSPVKKPHGLDPSDVLATKLGKSRFPAKKNGEECFEDFCFRLSPRYSAYS